MGLTTYLYRGYNPFTKYHGHPSRIGSVKSRILRTYKQILTGIPWTPLAYPFAPLFFQHKPGGNSRGGVMCKLEDGN